eukprot:gb/GEZN01003625.1/.p1 GENE.gb/GEZN01003625.1/~~gb/GEZN01003625.1/.p1  ORF type:complete len:616 (-),score=120.15 gb/GEZN01003625.1/:223-2070(-)
MMLWLCLLVGSSRATWSTSNTWASYAQSISAPFADSQQLASQSASQQEWQEEYGKAQREVEEVTPEILEKWPKWLQKYQRPVSAASESNSMSAPAKQDVAFDYSEWLQPKSEWSLVDLESAKTVEGDAQAWRLRMSSEQKQQPDFSSWPKSQQQEAAQWPKSRSAQAKKQGGGYDYGNEKAAAFDYSKYTGGEGGGTQGSGFDYSQYTSGAGGKGVKGGQGGFDYSQYMGGNGANKHSGRSSTGGFDYSQYMGGAAAGKTGGFDYSQYMNGGGQSDDSETRKKDKRTTVAEPHDSPAPNEYDYSEWVDASDKKKTKNGGYDYSQWIKKNKEGGYDYSKWIAKHGSTDSEKTPGVEPQQAFQTSNAAAASAADWATYLAKHNKQEQAEKATKQKTVEEYVNTNNNQAAPTALYQLQEDTSEHERYLDPAYWEQHGKDWQQKQFQKASRSTHLSGQFQQASQPVQASNNPALFGKWSDYIRQAHQETPGGHSHAAFSAWQQAVAGDQTSQIDTQTPSWEGLQAYTAHLKTQQNSNQNKNNKNQPVSSLYQLQEGQVMVDGVVVSAASMAWGMFSIIGYCLVSLTLAVGLFVGYTACRIFHKRRQYEQLDKLLIPSLA